MRNGGNGSVRRRSGTVGQGNGGGGAVGAYVGGDAPWDWAGVGAAEAPCPPRLPWSCYVG